MRQAIDGERSELSALLTEEDTELQEAEVADHPHTEHRLQPGVLRPLAAEPPPVPLSQPQETGSSSLKPHSPMEPLDSLFTIKLKSIF